MRQVYHDCIPFSSLAGRSEHAGFMVLPNSTKLESRALDTPKEAKRQCAWSTSHISCPGSDDSSDDPDPDCDMLSLQAKMLYKRSEKEPMDYCKQNTRKDATQYEGFTTDGLQINFPTFPSSGDLAKKFGASNVVSYDGIKPDDCNDFDFGIVTTPNEPGKNKPRYDAEHVLGAQVRSNVLSYDSGSDNDGDTEMGEADDDGFNEPRQGHTGVIHMCDYMKVWWAKNDDDKNAWSAHKFVASAYPGKDGRKWINAEEFVLLPAYINSSVKANYFGGNEETHKTCLNVIMKKAKDKRQPDWGSALKYVKAHIYFYKYLGTPEIQRILGKQVNRVVHNMYEFHPHDTVTQGQILTSAGKEQAEDNLLQQNIGGIQGYVDPKAPYRKQDFADEWRILPIASVARS
ncbi:hypothetical protein N7532_003596 [Penicillium argentinense]|uniref:Uncharacterized protein n=1 Tax=Penicillium argentinense TaxID=1131581 RepID=A0A9W9KFC9_9EURO|nr:uncharacterized protein N7532_003596 [Penicillium argentinense]KAJ5103067.1 hypothetical protein N7532_003596 [Penicillium argentinense]